MQAPAAGTVCKWQMELACRCHYGPSDQAQGKRYTMIPKRYDVHLHKHLQKAPIAVVVELTLTLLSNPHPGIHAAVLCTCGTAPWCERQGTFSSSIMCVPELFTIQVTAAVVTCGGLCPGLNDVIQNIVFTLEDYGVPPDQIFGIKYGLRGFYDRDFKPINLNKSIVQNIHLQGGTMLVRNLFISASS